MEFVPQHARTLIRALDDPASLGTLDLADWNALLPLSRSTGVFPRLSVLAGLAALNGRLPAEVRPHLESGRIFAESNARSIRWEVNRIERALGDVDTPVILLKGAAYLAAGLRASQGRVYSDTDILVAKDKLDEVESALLKHGWAFDLESSLDREYFRKWLHELPPLRHRVRNKVLDVHHTILPATDRIRLDPQKLIDRSVPVEGLRCRVLCPHDMVLHSAAHLFRNGRFNLGLRDLGDLTSMFGELGEADDFWSGLVSRAEELDLTKPLFCGLRYAELVYGFAPPESVRRAIRPWRPSAPCLALLDRLVRRALAPRWIDREDRRRNRAIWWLSHWPIPRPRVMATALFWKKRFPKLFANTADASD